MATRERIGREDRVEIFPLPPGLVIEKDIWVATRGGARLSVNVYRPQGEGPFPVVMGITVYGKDDPASRYAPAGSEMRREMGLGLGDLRISEACLWEGPDPAYWCAHGYAVVAVDGLGAHKSEGERDPYGAETMEAYCDAIAWAADQPWSNGRVGLNGVSYLAISQWFVAALQPRGLAAIVPWEGVSDIYRDATVHGGIPETAFLNWWQSGRSGMAGAGGEPEFTTEGGPLIDSAPYSPDLTRITVPALICGTWSDQGLHTRGSFTAYLKASSADKFLFTHGRGKWTVYHSPEALDYQRAFLDRFLKLDPNAETIPPVHLEVRQTFDTYAARAENEWPLARTRYTPFFLDAGAGALTPAAPEAAATASYESRSDDELNFRHRFDEDTEVTGHMALRLWVSTDIGPDMDLFVGIRKFDAAGEEVFFEGRENDAFGIVASGWLRVSLRKLDPAESTPWRPVQTFDEEQLLAPGQIVQADIEILPSSTLFEAGSTLQLTLKGRDVHENRMLQHKRLRNNGRHVIHTGGAHGSHLLLPIIPTRGAGGT